MNRRLIHSSICLTMLWVTARAETWNIDTADEWAKAADRSEHLKLADGFAETEGKTALFQSVVRQFKDKKKASALVFTASPDWNNWEKIASITPENLGDAPVALALGPENYWVFGIYSGKKNENFEATDATLPGFDIPLKTCPYPNQFNAPGGLKESQGGYHAWQSKDMVNWVHHGPVTERKSRWTTTAEYADGKLYMYYDFPNDQDPHVFVDDDLFDGKPGTDMGMAFKDPSNGSDCAVIRDLEGNFHLIYEDWSPINAQKHAWDSPLAGRAVSTTGTGDFKIMDPAVDYRTRPTGKTGEHTHPHWAKEDPENYPTNIVKYEIHEPEQDAFGDWAAICVGGQYYLFGDFDPKHVAGTPKPKMSVAMLTSSSIDKPFRYYHHVGEGHPDPDIMFAEGKFYLLTQTKNDFVSSGPWVEKVEARVGVDITNDGRIDQWTDWQEVKERYDHIEGFVKQIKRIPASIDLSSLPEGYGFAFEFKTEDTTENDSKPVLDSVRMSFNP